MVNQVQEEKIQHGFLKYQKLWKLIRFTLGNRKPVVTKRGGDDHKHWHDVIPLNWVANQMANVIQFKKMQNDKYLGKKS